jgi:hypothetical protein
VWAREGRPRGCGDAGGVGVVEDVETAAEGVGEQLRAEGGAADADEEDVAEALAVGGRDGPGVKVGGEGLDLLPARADGRGDRRVGRELRGAQPVVADHAALVGVGERARLDPGHRRQRGLQARRGGLEVLAEQPGVAEVELDGGLGEDDAPGEVLLEGRHAAMLTESSRARSRRARAAGAGCWLSGQVQGAAGCWLLRQVQAGAGCWLLRQVQGLLALGTGPGGRGLLALETGPGGRGLLSAGSRDRSGGGYAGGGWSGLCSISSTL